MKCSTSFIVTHFFVCSFYTKWLGLQDQWAKRKSKQRQTKQIVCHPSESIIWLHNSFLKSRLTKEKVSSLFRKMFSLLFQITFDFFSVKRRAKSLSSLSLLCVLIKYLLHKRRTKMPQIGEWFNFFHFYNFKSNSYFSFFSQRNFGILCSCCQKTI